MPDNVLRQIKTDYCLPLDQIPSLLFKLAANGEPIKTSNGEKLECPDPEAEETVPITEPLAYTCPECNATLLKIDDGKTEQFRCNVGHI